MKFEIYWPIEKEKDLIINQNLKIILESELEFMEDSVIMRNFEVFYKNDLGEEKIFNIQQIHIICWNDHTIPKAEVGYKALDAVMTLIDDNLKEYNKSIIINCR